MIHISTVADISAAPEMLSNLYFRKGEVRHSKSRTLRTFTHLQLQLLFIKKISRKLFAKPMLLPFPAF